MSLLHVPRPIYGFCKTEKNHFSYLMISFAWVESITRGKLTKFKTILEVGEHEKVVGAGLLQRAKEE